MWEPGQRRYSPHPSEPDAPTGGPEPQSRYCERCDEWYPEADITIEAKPLSCAELFTRHRESTGYPVRRPDDHGTTMALAHTLDTGELHFVVEDPDYRPCKPDTAGIPRTSESERLGMELARAQRRGDKARRVQ